MREAANKLDRDVARSRFRQHLARTREILEGHAQAAMAEARGKVKRAATILSERLKTDATFQVEVDALDHLMKRAFPPIDLPLPPPMAWPALSPSENPKHRTRKARKTHAKKD